MKLNGIIVALCSVGILNAHAENVAIAKSSLVGDGIVEFVPQGFDQTKTPSLILKEEPTAKGSVPSDWELYPQFTVMDGKANASLGLTGEISLYGGGEVTGPLLRNGQYIKLWNTDTGAYGVDGGKRLYQSHPWVLGVRRDGSAFGILFDSSWKSELHTNSDKIEFNTEGALFRIYIIDRESPKDVLKGLAELTGTITMPARWTLGYHQCRFSYGSEQKVREIADNFRSRNIPCDAIWMDIDYMDGYRIFTFNETTFPDPKALNEELHQKGFKAVYMIDPGAKVDKNYHVYQSGTENDVWVKRPNGEIYEGKVWPGYCAFPDFTMPKAREWWSNLYKDFLALGIDGVWNDMNEPAVTDDDIPEENRIGTMPYDTPHRGGGNLPAGPHLLYHNAPQGASLLAIGAVAMIFMALEQTINGSLQGLGLVFVPAQALLCGIGVKLALNLTLIRLPQVNIYGASFGSLGCYATACTICLVRLLKALPMDLAPKRYFWKPLACAVLMGIAAHWGHAALTHLIGSSRWALLITIPLAAVLYGLFVLASGILTKAEIAQLPLIGRKKRSANP